MNRVAKGTRNEKKCADLLKDAGYIIHRTRRSRFGANDFFNLFDVMAVHPLKDHMLFIQVKSNVVSKKVKKEIFSFPLPPCCVPQIWVHIDRKGFHVIKELNG